MTPDPHIASAAPSAIAGASAIAAYAAWAAAYWYRYGRVGPACGDERDPLLDRFMPSYDVVERHAVCIRAPAETALAAACELDWEASRFARAIFAVRAFVLRARRDTIVRPRPLLPYLETLGWRVLEELPGREIVAGAVTQPWEANVVFRPLDPPDFISFHEPGYVKIAWTLRADPIAADRCIFRTETRAVATDRAARAAFRPYWACASPGILLVRRLLGSLIQAEAERRASASAGRCAAKLGAAGLCGDVECRP
jgi:hypothetical protein